MASTTNSTTPQVHHQSSTHMMKTTRTGRPFVKDIHDLFSTLIVSLPMETHRHMFRSYPNTFTTDEAVQNLGSLKFTQSNRTPDPRDQSRIITTTTTTTFSMTRDMAKSVCQTFMDARLFESISDAGSRSFKDKGLYALTPKGLFVLERFVTRNGITSSHLARLLASQTTIRLYYLERSPENDSLLLTWHVLEPVFRHFGGRQPNVVRRGAGGDEADGDSNRSGERGDRNLGIELKDHKGTRYTFAGASAVEWLCDFTTVVSREEAQKVGTAFLQHKLIAPVAKWSSGAQQNLTADPQPEAVRMSKSTVYTFNENGHRVAGWNVQYETISDRQTTNERVAIREMLSTGNLRNNNNARGNSSLSRQPSNISTTSAKSTADPSTDSQTNGAGSASTIRRANRGSMSAASGDGSTNVPIGKESTARRLQQILDDKPLCDQFMEFLKTNLCSENLLFLLDVRDFKERFGSDVNDAGEPRDPTVQRRLVTDAFRIYNTYLASGASNELNIDHVLQKQTSAHITSIVSSTKDGIGQLNDDTTTSIGDATTAPKLTTSVGDATTAPKLTTSVGDATTALKLTTSVGDATTAPKLATVHLFDKIEETIFRLVASDSVPKFVRTDAYLTQGRRDDANNEGHRHQTSVSTTSSGSTGSAPNAVAAT